MDFYEKIEKLCTEKGISPTKAALDLGISKSNQTNWKRGTKPQNRTISKIAKYFDVPVSYFTESDSTVESQTIHDNHGIIGSTHAPVTIINGSERKLSEQAVELLSIFEKLNVIDQANLLVYAAGLLKESK